MKMWCDHCAWNVRTDRYSGRIFCCSLCGKVLSDDNFTEEATFVKTADGQAPIAGNIVKSTEAKSTESQKRAHDESDYGIENMYALGVDGGHSISGRGLHMCKDSGCTMMWCSYCGRNGQTVNNWGQICCSTCGMVLTEDFFVEAGTGYIVKLGKAESTESQNRAVDEEDYGTESDGIIIDGGDDM